MALIVLCSASGSPGVTGSALGLAMSWPRPVLLVEGDPTGGSSVFAGYLRALAAPSASLIDVALASRYETLDRAVADATIPMPGTLRLAGPAGVTTSKHSTAETDVHLEPKPGRPAVSLLSGTRAHGQARSLLQLWEPLAAAFKRLESTGQDVIVDAGRLGLVGSPEPLVYAADLALLVVRSDLVALSGARSWADTLRTGFERVGGASSLGLLMVGQKDPYGAREVAKVLQVPVTATLAWDPEAAAVFARGAKAPRKFDTSPLLRSLTAARASIEATVAANRDQLGAGTDDSADPVELDRARSGVRGQPGPSGLSGPSGRTEWVGRPDTYTAAGRVV